MTLGVDVRTRTARVARGIPVDISRWFVTGQTASGSVDEPVLVRSIGDFSVEYGARATHNDDLYDAVETYFQEGGREAYIGRHNGTYADGLALFDPDLGPGQVSVIGAANDASIYTALYGHAKNNNRVGVLDVNSGLNVGGLQALGAAARGLSNNDYGAVFGPWVDVPAPAGVIGGSARQVPAAPVVAALCARADALGNPNRAAAGRDFPLQYVTDFDLRLTKAEREATLDAGVNTFAEIYGVLENYGFQTAVAQTIDHPYWQFNAARTRMYLKAKAQAAGEPYVFKTIDGQGRLAGGLKGDIDDICLQLYNANGLFGETPQEAFSTEVGAAINTIDTVAQGELHAVVEARLSLHAKAVLIDLVTVPVTGQVSQP